MNLFDVTRGLPAHIGPRNRAKANMGPRVANNAEIKAYLIWLAAKRGIEVPSDAEFSFAGIGSESLGCVLIMPGYGDPTPTVTMETLDESGEVIASQTLPVEPKKGGVIWDKAAIHRACGPMPKPAKVSKARKVKAAPPIVEPAPPPPTPVAQPVQDIKRGRPITLAHRTTRSEWREAWRAARKGNLSGKALFDHLEGMGLTRSQVCLLHTAIETARRPMLGPDDFRRVVLNCFGASSPYRSPPMDSPYFTGWQRTVRKVSDLVARLEKAGRIKRDDGGYVDSVSPLPEIPASAGAVERVEAPDAYDGQIELDALQGPNLPPDELATIADKFPADPVADLLQRVAALEARMDALPVESVETPIVGKAPRTPAHERAIRRAWQKRQEARLQRSIAADQMRMREQVQSELRKVSADLETLRPQYENAAKARTTWMKEAEAACERERVALAKRRRVVIKARDLQRRAAIYERECRAAIIDRDGARQRVAVLESDLSRLQASLADANQPERESDIARLVSERDELRTALSAVSARAERQSQALDEMAERFERIASRMARAEAALRRSGNPIAA